MKTDFETLRALSSYMINLLTESKHIQYPIETRTELIEAVATEFAVSFATEEDIKDQAIEEVEEKLGQGVIEGDITETEVYNHARKEIIKSFNGEAISGLYLVESLNQVAQRLKNYLLTSEYIDDVYSSDEELIDFIITKIRNFSLKRG